MMEMVDEDGESLEGASVIGYREGVPIMNIHKYPVDDLREHSYSVGCWCACFPELDESGVYIVKHVAMDCREFWEEDVEYEALVFGELYRREMADWRRMN